MLGGKTWGGVVSWSKSAERSCGRGCVGDGARVGGSEGGCRAASGVGF